MKLGSREISRRDVLKTAGVGLATGVFATPVAARNEVRVFAHPTVGDDVRRAVIAYGGKPQTYDHFDFVAARLPARAVAALARDDRVASVEPDGVVRAVPVQRDRSRVRGHRTRQTASWGYVDIAADSAHALGYRGEGVGIAILDTGVDTGHRDLRVAGGKDCVSWWPWNADYDDKNGHGTHCAGIAAARNNDRGVLGVAPDADLYAVKVLRTDGSGYWSDVIQGIDWCLSRRIPIISMSLGSSTIPSALRATLAEAYDAGHLLVAAAGNNGNDGDGDCAERNVDTPARNNNVLAVGASTEDGDVALFSSVGTRSEITAPGLGIYSTYKNNSYATMSGTSMATPHVAGVAALVWEAGDYGRPTADEGRQVRDVLTATASRMDGTCDEGHGLVDAYEAVRTVRW